MSESTLESLAARVTELERKLAVSPSIIPATRDWRSVVGMFEGSESMMRVDAEIAAMRAAEHTAPDEGVAK